MGRQPKDPPAGQLFDLPPEDALLDFRERFGADLSKVTVLRAEVMGGPPAGFLGSVSLDECTYEFIQEKWGPGKYILRSLNGQNRYTGAATIKIAAPSGVAPSGAAAPAYAGSPDNKFLQDTMLPLFVKMVQPPAPIDIGGLLTGLAGHRAEPIAWDKILVAAPAAIAALMAIFKPTGENPKDQIKQFIETLQLAKDFVSPPQPEKEENLYTAGKEIVREVIQAFKPPPTAPAAIEPARLAAAEGHTVAASMDPAAAFPQFLATLKQKARQGKPAAFYVDYVLINDDEPVCASILTALGQGIGFDRFVAIDPEIAADPVLLAFFKEMFDGLSSALREPMDTDGEAGDVANPGGDGAPGAPAVAASAGPGKPPTEFIIR